MFSGTQYHVSSLTWILCVPDGTRKSTWQSGMERLRIGKEERSETGMIVRWTLKDQVGPCMGLEPPSFVRISNFKILEPLETALLLGRPKRHHADRLPVSGPVFLTF